MVNPIITSLAVFGASATALSVGSAHVVNQCNYDVYLCNVPASGGGHEESDKTLSAGESWTQQWTELTNGNGWSIKLSKSDSLENILQYEYTFHNDGIIWYDLSCVNGNPWDKDWEITSSTDSCKPKQQAYRYATDDAYGMQSCSQDNSITVTLCSGLSADNGTAVDSGSGSGSGSDDSSSAPSYSTPASSAPAYSSPVESSAAPSTTANQPIGYNLIGDDNKGNNYTPTTLATSASSTTAVATDGDGVVQTVIETFYTTQLATATAYVDGNSRIKRHQHEHHQLGHQHNA